MKKEEKDLRRLFREDARQGYLSAERKEQAIRSLLSSDRGQAACQADTMGISYPERIYLARLWMQLRYMDKGAMLFQATLLAAIIAVSAVYGQKNSILYPAEDLYMLAGFSSVAFSTAALAACGISDRYGIAELAGSCFFDHRQVCVLRMTLSSVVGSVSLSVLMLTVHGYTGSLLWRTAIYLFVPYLVTGCTGSALLCSRLFGRSPFALWANGLVMAAVSAAASSVEGVYGAAATGIWILVLVIAAAVWAFELAVLFKRIERGDMLCMY